MNFVPVVVHRLFGTRLEPLEIGPPDLRGPFGGRVTSVPGFDIGGSRVIPVVDERYGPAMTTQQIAALFVADDTLAYTTGLTVNTIWEAHGVGFTQIALVDHRLPSYVAALIPADRHLFDADFFAKQHSRPGAMNIFLVGEMEGRFGTAGWYAPGVEDSDIAYGYVSARNELATRFGIDDYWWRSVVGTLAHELGHVLGLPHEGEQTNLMYTWARNPDHREVYVTQGRVVHWYAQHLPWPALSGGIAHIGVDTPRPWDRHPGLGV